uniref:Dipeptidyl peptidase 8-like n=1 Tax=Phallusia mammillata TaxID=59560 RepID=A0A6F9DC35_9ASCI|nr:dipeptidyl peptidase 8-like [Phallusia mammillata]
MASSHQVISEDTQFGADTKEQSDSPMTSSSENTPQSNMQTDTMKSSWQEIKRSVRTSRKMHAQFANKIPHDFVFVPIPSDSSKPDMFSLSDKQTSSGTRILFLGVLPDQRENTLLYIDVPTQPSPQLLDKPSEWKSALGFFQANSIHADKYSKEEELLRERKRLSVHGITSYQISSDNSQLLFPAAGSLFTLKLSDIGRTEAPEPTEVFTRCSGCRMDPKMSPNDPNLIAFIHENDLWVTNTKSQTEKRLTHTHKGCKNPKDETLSAGVACYIVQEEFDRYTGYWWQPNNPSGQHRILYETVDESEVEISYISNPLGNPGLDTYRYPKAGTPNARVTLRMLEFSTDDEGQISDVVIKKLSEPLSETFPWMEYIVRINWLPSGKGIWAQLLDRKQQKSAVIYIPLCKFERLASEMNNLTSSSPTMDDGANNVESDVEMSDCTMSLPSTSSIKILYEETSDIWINLHDAFHFFHNDPADEVNFIWASEQTGHRHLYHISCQLKKPNRSKRHSTGDLVSNECRSCVSCVTPLTSGEWEVLEHPDSIWVDEVNQNVYFMGLKETVLESHLYVTSYANRQNPARLTNSCAAHSVSMSKDCQLFITVSSSIKELYSAKVYRLSPRPVAAVNLLEPQGLVPDYVPPDLFSFTNSNGDTLHGLYHKPRNMEPDKKYPTVLYIYGGPHVQLVTNSFKGLRYQRLYTLSSLGYVVVAIDGRGSPHRGLQFEGYLKNKMGQVEISDQVEGLQSLAQKCKFIDLSRVAIHGWSYGGYLSLMALAQRPDIFKIAIAGAPVVNWELYDTGYTERYMGMPLTNPEGYLDGSVMKSVNKFPNEPNRLLVVHGLIDENVHFVHTTHLINALVKHCKPYQLQIYPGERHGIRRPDSNEHFEVEVISFLQQYL